MKSDATSHDMTMNGAAEAQGRHAGIPEPSRYGNNHQLALYLAALVIFVALSYAVYVTPLNLNDFLMHLFLFETRSLYRTFERAFIDHPHGPEWRPLQLLSAQIIYQYLAQGYEHLVFKGMLVVSLCVTGGLFVRLLKVESWPDVLAGVIAIFVLVGHQSFTGAVEAVYPYGVEIILVACELAVLNILLRKSSIASELVALALSVFAIFLNEKGGLVGVTYIVGSVLRLPGGTLRSAAFLFAIYVLVVLYRISWFKTVFDITERSVAHDPAGALFNTVAPILNILISDPRYGVFRAIPQAFMARPWAIIYLASSLLLSALIVAWAWSNLRQAKGTYSDELKVAAILPFLLLGSAMFGPFSQKDYIAIMALTGYAVVSFYALKWLFSHTLQAPRLATYALLLSLGVGLAFCWSVRAAGLVFHLRNASFSYQEEWVSELDRLGKAREFPASVTQPIIARLQPEALWRPLNDPNLVFPLPIVRLMQGRGCPEVCN